MEEALKNAPCTETSVLADSKSTLQNLEVAFKGNVSIVEDTYTFIGKITKEFIIPLVDTRINADVCAELIERLCADFKISKRITRQLVGDFKQRRVAKKLGGNSKFYFIDDRGTLKINEVAVAETILQSDDHFIYSSEGCWRKYRDGKYVNVDEHELRNQLIMWLDPSVVTDKNIHSIMNIAASRCFHPYIDFDSNPSYINCSNGIYDLVSHTLLPHTPDYYSIIQSPASFLQKDEINCPNFEKLLDTITKGDPEQKENLLEMIGYFLTPHNKAKKAFIFLGPGNTGKTTLIRLIMTLIVGEENCSSVAWQDLEKDFMLSALLGKSLNVSDDLPAKKLEENGTFKIITGGGAVNINRKHKAMLNAVLPVKFLFACNNLPQNISGDRSDAFYDRLYIFDFNNVISAKDRDPDLLEKLTSERDSIFSLAIQAVERLEANKYRFKETESTLYKKAEYKKQSDTVKQFIDDLFVFRPNFGFPVRVTFDLYVLYCEKTKLKSCSLHEFKRRLLSLDGIKEIQHGKQRTRTYHGIYLSSEKYEEIFGGPLPRDLNKNIETAQQTSIEELI